jgi:hypothetical protein
MKRLYLDDIRPCPFGWEVARTPEEFKRMVLEQEWDEMSLDHDLADIHYEEMDGRLVYTGPRTRPEDGYDLVRWLFKQDREKLPKSKPNVHSANPAGAKRMREYIDYAWENKDFDDPDYGL